MTDDTEPTQPSPAFSDGSTLTDGVVKWFDPIKGFGFVVADEGGADILLHVNVLRNFGQSSVADGARVKLAVQQTSRGVQAIEVIAIQPPEPQHPEVLSEMAGFHQDAIDQAPLEPARVKWFDKAKGFGFANVFGKSEDIFLHIEILRKAGFADLQPGEAMALRVISGNRGAMAIEVQPWEAALQTKSET